AFNFTIKSAETGNVQVRTVPSPSDALGVGAGLPEELPVLNQLLSIAFENMTSTRSGELIQANGIYTRGHVEPTVGWFGFGVVEVRTGDGFLEYLGFDWHHGTAEKRMEWAKLLQMLVTINYGRL
ncbi:Crt-like 1, partial [Durusdinium trenchii]